MSMNQCLSVILLPVIRIPLSQGKFATVNECDWPALAGRKWYAVVNGKCEYAVSHRRKNDPLILMHRLILGTPKGWIDHKNRNGLDNRRSNLRPATPRQNAINTVKKAGISGFRGVTWDNNQGIWMARICDGLKRRTIGRFSDPKMAAIAYNIAAKEKHGEYAILNEVHV